MSTANRRHITREKAVWYQTREMEDVVAGSWTVMVTGLDWCCVLPRLPLQ